VAADYGGAVSGGSVVSAYEYEEQLGFLETAIALVPKASRSAEDAAALTARVEALRAAVRGKEDAKVVASIGRAAREDVVSRLGLLTTPRQRPGLKRAESLYAQSCTTCHGIDGLGRTEVAASLDPKPTSFRDPARPVALSRLQRPDPGRPGHGHAGL
jgi:high-affinity iron transporter